MPIVKKGSGREGHSQLPQYEKGNNTLLKKDQGRVFSPQSPRFVLDDIILAKETKSQLLDALSFFKYQNLIFDEWGLSETHKNQKKLAINFYGPPGTGKTMAAHAAASHLGKKILEVSYADIESKYVGETPKNLEKVFKEAEDSNCVLFFDEADAVLSRRVTSMSNSTDVSVNQTRSVLLMLLNNFSGSVFFATNFIQNYDPAFMRRMLASIEFKMPDLEARQKLWEKLMPSRLPADLNVCNVASKFDDVSGSDISNAILSASLKAAREGVERIPVDYFVSAVLEIKRSKGKNNNSSNEVSVVQKEVSESYVKEKLGTTEKGEA